jgi:hypothetical protein
MVGRNNRTEAAALLTRPLAQQVQAIRAFNDYTGE